MGSCRAPSAWLSVPSRGETFIALVQPNQNANPFKVCPHTCGKRVFDHLTTVLDKKNPKLSTRWILKKNITQVFQVMEPSRLRLLNKMINLNYSNSKPTSTKVQDRCVFLTDPKLNRSTWTANYQHLQNLTISNWYQFVSFAGFCRGT